MKKFFQKYLPKSSTLKEHKHLRIFGAVLTNQNLWHLNRRSVARAFAIGLFVMYMPLPFQMLIAAAVAILARANIPVAVVTVWISNPFTMPAMFYLAYKIGVMILGGPLKPLQFELSWHWLTQQLGQIWQPLLLGSVICGTVLAIIGYFAVTIIWRMVVKRNWRRRKLARKIKR